jgi:hypothetical protein
MLLVIYRSASLMIVVYSQFTLPHQYNCFNKNPIPAAAIAASLSSADTFTDA